MTAAAVTTVLVIAGGAVVARWGERLADWLIPTRLNFKIGAELARLALRLARSESEREEGLDALANILAADPKSPGGSPMASIAPVLLRCVRSALHHHRGLHGVESALEDAAAAATFLWQEVDARLRGALPDTTYSTWFSDARGADLDSQTFVLTVPDEFTRDWIEVHFLGLMQVAIRDVTGSTREIVVDVDASGLT